MVLRIDPRNPLVWRNPSSLQFGVDAPLAVLTEVSTAQERLIAALVAGVSRSGLDMIARTAHARPGELDSLLEHLGPVLEPPATIRPAASVQVVGVGPTFDQLITLLRSGGASIGDDDAGLAVVVSHHVLPPELYGRWLSRDVPHLPVVYGDSVVRIGPIIEPGSGPCLYCIDLHRTDTDPAWPAIASQLWGRESPLETALVASEVAVIAARLVLSRLAAGTAGPAESIVLDAESGEIGRRAWVPHPECGCVQLSADLPENARERAGLPGPIPLSTRKG